MSEDAGPRAADFDVTRVAERALLVRFHDDELATAVARTHALVRALKARKPRTKDKDRDFLFRGEWVPGAGNLLVLFPPDASARDVEAARQDLEAEVPSLSIDGSLGLGMEVDAVSGSGTEHVFEVRYGGEEGPDLEAVARETGLAPERVIERHSAAHYLVAFVGFSPGFGYLIGVPAELEVSRLGSPRTRVPAGSVAIAGAFSAVYPSATPGGWRLIGRLADPEARLFDAAAERPSRLAAGDRVRFVACR